MCPLRCVALAPDPPRMGTLTQPSGYRGPLDPGRDRQPGQVMADLVAENLIRQIMDLHDDLCRSLDRDVELAAIGQADPASGYVTGSGDHDQMLVSATAVRQAEQERARRRKNANQRLRNLVEDYEVELGRRMPRRPRVESIDYRNGGERRVG